jgi:hypothetical protein
VSDGYLEDEVAQLRRQVSELVARLDDFEWRVGRDLDRIHEELPALSRRIRALAAELVAEP